MHGSPPKIPIRRMPHAETCAGPWRNFQRDSDKTWQLQKQRKRRIVPWPTTMRVVFLREHVRIWAALCWCACVSAVGFDVAWPVAGQSDFSSPVRDKLQEEGE